MKYLLAGLAAMAALAGCTGEPARLAVVQDTSELTVRPAVRSVLVGEVTLPEYASAPEVARQTESGLIEVVPGVIWADNPADALSDALVRNLSTITGRQVAATPWPLEERPQVEITVRVERLLVQADGVLQMTGQYAIRSVTDRERLKRFSVALPMTGDELADYATAYGRAWRLLAEDIAGAL